MELSLEILCKTNYYLVKMKFIEQWKRRQNNKIVLGEGVNPWLVHKIQFAPDAVDNEIYIGSGFRCGKFALDIQGQGNKVFIGDQVRFGGKLMIRGKGIECRIGSHCHCVDAYVLAYKANLTIGEHCLISREVVIRNSDVHKIFNKGDEPKLSNAQNPPQDLTIGRHVWVGARAFVSKGAQIPEECVIGASSFVNKSFVESHCIIAGTPAKIVKRHIDWER